VSEVELDHHAAMTGPDLIEFVDHKLFPYLAAFKHSADHAQVQAGGGGSATKKRRSLHAPPFPMKKYLLLLLTVWTTLSDSDDISVTSNTVKELHHSYKHNNGVVAKQFKA